MMKLIVYGRDYRVQSCQRLPKLVIDVTRHAPGEIDSRLAWSYLAEDKEGKRFCITIRVPLGEGQISADDVPTEVVAGIKGIHSQYILFASGFSTDLYRDINNNLSVSIRLATGEEEARLSINPPLGRGSKGWGVVPKSQEPADVQPLPAEKIELTMPIMEAIRNRLAEHDGAMKARPTLSEFFQAYMIQKMSTNTMRAHGWSDRTIRNRRCLAERVIAEHFGGKVQLRKFRDSIDPRVWGAAERELKRARERGCNVHLE